MVKPLFDRGLSVRPGDGDDRYVELIPVVAGQVLQRIKRVADFEQASMLEVFQSFRLFHHEVAHSSMVKFLNVSVSVVAL